MKHRIKLRRSFLITTKLTRLTGFFGTCCGLELSCVSSCVSHMIHAEMKKTFVALAVVPAH